MIKWQRFPFSRVRYGKNRVVCQAANRHFTLWRIENGKILGRRVGQWPQKMCGAEHHIAIKCKDITVFGNTSPVWPETYAGIRPIEASNLFEESVNMSDLWYNHERLGFYGRADRGSSSQRSQSTLIALWNELLISPGRLEWEIPPRRENWFCLIFFVHI